MKEEEKKCKNILAIGEREEFTVKENQSDKKMVRKFPHVHEKLALALVLAVTMALCGRASKHVYSPCDKRVKGQFSDTCRDIQLLPDHKTLNASCATDGSMTKFKVNDNFNLDQRVLNHRGQLLVVLYCAPIALPFWNVDCTFSRECRNITLEVVNPPINANDKLTNATSNPVFLRADCPDPHGQFHSNQLDLNPYVTNDKGMLKWSCRL